MNTLIYMAHGADCYRDEAIYSILSLWRHHAPDVVCILVATDDPAHFQRVLGQHDTLRYLPLTPAQLQAWRGSVDYLHRIKSCAMLHAMQTVLQEPGAAPGDTFMFVDSDTSFMAPVLPVFERIRAGTVVLHASEGTPEATHHETRSKHRLYQAIQAHRFQVCGAERQLRTGMTLWNSGIIGIRADQIDLLEQTIAAIDAIYPVVQINTVEQIALSAVLDVRSLPVADCEDVVLHYHVFKEFRADLAQFFARYAGSSLAQWLAHWPEVDPAQRIQPKLAFNARPKWQRQWLKLIGRRWAPLPYPWASPP